MYVKCVDVWRSCNVIDLYVGRCQVWFSAGILTLIEISQFRPPSFQHNVRLLQQGINTSFLIPSSCSFPIYSVVDAGSKVNQKKNRVKCAEMVLGKAKESPMWWDIVVHGFAGLGAGVCYYYFGDFIWFFPFLLRASFLCFFGTKRYWFLFCFRVSLCFGNFLISGNFSFQ